jgi:hypothetical protein
MDTLTYSSVVLKKVIIFTIKSKKKMVTTKF